MQNTSTEKEVVYSKLKRDDAESRTNAWSMLKTDAEEGYKSYSNVKISLVTAHNLFTANPNEYPFYQIGPPGKIAPTFEGVCA